MIVFIPSTYFYVVKIGRRLFVSGNRKMSLHILMGPMFAGKSSEILHITNRYKSLGWNVCVIGHSTDLRYGNDEKLYTHNRESTTCLKTDDLFQVFEKEPYKNANVVIVDEAQFFPRLKEFTLRAVEDEGKQVYIVGLDGDADRKPFGELLDCIPYADSVKKLKAFCKLCGDGTDAIFTRCDKPSEKQGQVHVGGADMYQPVCRKHFIES
jgi:thymidine kinase